MIIHQNQHQKNYKKLKENLIQTIQVDHLPLLHLRLRLRLRIHLHLHPHPPHPPYLITVEVDNTHIISNFTIFTLFKVFFLEFRSYIHTLQ